MTLFCFPVCAQLHASWTFAFSINAGRRSSQATLEAAVCAFEWLCHISSSGDTQAPVDDTEGSSLEVAMDQLPSYRGSKQQQKHPKTVHYHSHKDGEADPSSSHNLTPLELAQYTAEQVARFTGQAVKTLLSLVSPPCRWGAWERGYTITHVTAYRSQFPISNHFPAFSPTQTSIGKTRNSLTHLQTEPTALAIQYLQIPAAW